jgi:Holliday junction resolvase-like predicted endonuclease
MVGGINDFFLLSIVNRANCRAKAHILTVGNKAEKLALQYLKKNGLKLVEQNYLTKFGEIDIIMLDKLEQTLVFVEVRYREIKKQPVKNSVLAISMEDRIIFFISYIASKAFFIQFISGHFKLDSSPTTSNRQIKSSYCEVFCKKWLAA